jgi:hypothetical protein
MSLDDVRAAAEQAGRSRQQYNKDKDALRAAITAADRGNKGRNRNKIAEAARAGLSRRLVFEVFQVADLLTDAQKAVADIQGVRVISRSGDRVWLAVDDLFEDLYESDDRSPSFSIRLTRNGQQAVRAAMAALAKAELTVTDAEPLENGGEAEITRAAEPT